MHQLIVDPISPRPFLKWAGGKGQLIAQYRPFFPAEHEYDTYYEPFVGGGAIFFWLLPGRSRLMDINPELVNVYRCVRSEVEAVIQALRVHELNHNKEYYYFIRAHLPERPAERAARFIYLNKTCFNGLYRENSRGQFNVPMGSYKNPRICNPDLLRTASRALRRAELIEGSFDQVLQEAVGDRDFVYFDPPYQPLSQTSSFTAYSRYSFTETDQVRLRDVFVELAARGVRVLLSNSDCEFIRELYQGFPIQTISAIRAINSNAQRRGKITEVLVMSREP
ncbi:DNA adenine methylase [Leptolyngbya sp. AN02str]|uniref:DNA adenine methylase n=1 Tax=Leptolyngbya sp. AN02str TaxID=3423363 RepID=UPI003D3112FE